MSCRLTDKVVFITGAAREAGPRPCRPTGEAAGRGIVSAAADTRDLDALCAIVDKGVAQFGRLDVIIANAGITVPEPSNETMPESFKDVMTST